jgi:hypothetical protein
VNNKSRGLKEGLLKLKIYPHPLMMKLDLIWCGIGVLARVPSGRLVTYLKTLNRFRGAQTKIKSQNYIFPLATDITNTQTIVRTQVYLPQVSSICAGAPTHSCVCVCVCVCVWVCECG